MTRFPHPFKPFVVKLNVPEFKAEGQKYIKHTDCQKA